MASLQVLLGPHAHIRNAALRLLQGQRRRRQEAGPKRASGSSCCSPDGTLHSASCTSSLVNGRNRIVQVTLNSVWKLAMPPLSIAEFQNEKPTVYWIE